MSKHVIHNFGIIDDTGDLFEFHWDADKGGHCRLEDIIQTERGPRRSEIASIPVPVWSAVSRRAVRELAVGMGETERLKKTAVMKCGTNRLSTLIGRELAVLLWALMEVEDKGSIEAILQGWRELAREERWWLYAKAAAPGQRAGAGWRLALFHALSETPDSRVAEPVALEKKSPGNGSRSGTRAATKKKKEKKQRPASWQRRTPPIPLATARKRKQSPKPPTAGLNWREAKNPAGKGAKRMVRKAAQYNWSCSEKGL